MNPVTLLQYTVTGLMPILSTSLTGAYLARRGIFKSQTLTRISLAFTNYFAPLFIFCNITGSVNFDDIQTLWPLFLTPLMMAIFGRLISLLHSQFFTQIPYFSRIVVCMITFPALGNVPRVLMRGMCSPYGPLRGNPRCKEADAYVSLQVLTFSAIVWSYGYTLISQDKAEYQEHVERLKLLERGEVFKESPPFSLWRSAGKNLLMPSPVAGISGLIVGLIPGVRSTFFRRDSLVYALADTCIGIGMGGVILSQISLGANLVLLSSKREGFTKKYIASVVVFKNLITPLIALGIVYGLFRCGVFGDNIVMLYLVFISFSCPSALVIMNMTQLLGYGTHEVSLLMFWIYSSSIPGLVISTYLFFLIFSVI